MTCPAVIRGAEQWSRWSNLNHRPLLMSEGSERRSWLPGRDFKSHSPRPSHCRLATRPYLSPTSRTDREANPAIRKFLSNKRRPHNHSRGKS